MSDRFELKANCSKCGKNLNDDESGQILMLAVGDSIDLTCPKCGIIRRFWIDVETKSKEINKKKNHGKSH